MKRLGNRMMNLLRRYPLTATLIGITIGLGIFSAVFFSQAYVPIQKLGFSATPTITAPAITITSTSILLPIKLDPRIKEFRDLYGIELDDQHCIAPCITTLQNPLTLGEFIQKVGTPDKVYGAVTTEKPLLIAFLFYFRRGFSIYASRPAFYGSHMNLDLTPDMMVKRIDLWNSRTLPEIEIELSQLYKTDFHLAEGQDWSGFGSLKIQSR